MEKSPSGMTIADVREGVNFSEQISEIPIDDIKIRYRLRTPKQQMIKELSESIRTLGLLNPVTVDNELYLIAGFHRLHALKPVSYTHLTLPTKA